MLFAPASVLVLKNFNIAMGTILCKNTVYCIIVYYSIYVCPKFHFIMQVICVWIIIPDFVH